MLVGRFRTSCGGSGGASTLVSVGLSEASSRRSLENADSRTSPTVNPYDSAVPRCWFLRQSVGWGEAVAVKAKSVFRYRLAVSRSCWIRFSDQSLELAFKASCRGVTHFTAVEASFVFDNHFRFSTLLSGVAFS